MALDKKKSCGCITCTCGSGSRVASAVIAGVLFLLFLYIEFWS